MPIVRGISHATILTCLNKNIAKGQSIPRRDDETRSALITFILER